MFKTDIPCLPAREIGGIFYHLDFQNFASQSNENCPFLTDGCWGTCLCTMPSISTGLPLDLASSLLTRSIMPRFAAATVVIDHISIIDCRCIRPFVTAEWAIEKRRISILEANRHIHSSRIGGRVRLVAERILVSWVLTPCPLWLQQEP